VTRVHGKLFSDNRSGVLAIKPSRPFFGVSRVERHFEVIDGSIDITLDPTPSGIFYLLGYKEKGDLKRTEFTLRWSIPARESFDISPDADNSTDPGPVSTGASAYERVQLKRVAGDLKESLDDKDQLSQKLEAAESKVRRLEEEIEAYRRTAEKVLYFRDETIAKLQEQAPPPVKTRPISIKSADNSGGVFSKASLIPPKI